MMHARCESIRSLFRHKLEVVYSKDPDTDNGRGVAIVLNKIFMNVDDTKTTEIIECKGWVFSNLTPMKTVCYY